MWKTSTNVFIECYCLRKMEKRKLIKVQKCVSQRKTCSSILKVV